MVWQETESSWGIGGYGFWKPGNQVGGRQNVAKPGRVIPQIR